MNTSSTSLNASEANKSPEITTAICSFNCASFDEEHDNKEDVESCLEEQANLYEIATKHFSASTGGNYFTYSDGNYNMMSQTPNSIFDFLKECDEKLGDYTTEIAVFVDGEQIDKRIDLDTLDGYLEYQDELTDLLKSKSISKPTIF